MSDLAVKLLHDIENEYYARIKDRNNSEQTIVFDKDLFISKYKYDTDIIEDLLNELHQCGYIEKWITDNFILKND